MTYLKNHQILSSNDLHETRDLLAAMTNTDEIDVIGKGAEIDAAVNAASFGDLSMIHVSFGDAPVTIQTHEADADDLLMFIVTSGGGEVQCGKQSWNLSLNQGFMRDLRLPLQAQEEQFGAFCTPLSIQTMKKHARTLIGEDATLPELAFDPGLDLSTPGGRSVRNTVEYIAQTLDGPQRQLDNPFLLAALQDLLLTNVLTLLPNSYTDLFENRPTCAAVPYYVKRARDYIHANAHSPITLESLVSHAGCGYRTLQGAFKDAFGLPPMAYLKSERLKRVRNQLLEVGEEGMVNEVAQKWGFSHMGRFAQDYRKQFGVLPSQTLRSRK